MGEIKSTLDLVMEKTKHLTLSKEEREEQRITELKGNLKGLIQKLQDETLTQRQLKKEVNALQKSYDDLAVVDILRTVIIDKLNLDQDYMKLLVLLSEFCRVNIEEIKSVIEEYKIKIQAAKQKSKDKTIKFLAEKHSIFGSAIVPNLENDDNLKKELKRIQSEYEKMLKKEKEALKT